MEKTLEQEFIFEFNKLFSFDVEEEVSCAYLLDLFSDYSKDFHALAEIEKAYNFACSLHEGQKRDSGEPYINHPLSVAIILAKMHADKDTIIAGILHDAIEDTYTSKLNISQLFNGFVGTYVDGVSKIVPIENIPQKLDNEAYMRKLITGMGEDLEIMLIKLADKLHNMRTLNFKNREKQIETAKETLDLFVPFAERLGVYEVKNELEDLSLKYIDPKCYDMIKEALYEILKKRIYDIKRDVSDITAWLTALDIESSFKFSTKNIYGIYKAIEKDIPDGDYDANTIRKIIEEKQIHDLISVQILVKEEKQCYEANQVISSYYKTNKDETKDYIKNPKANMYRSLHTTIYDESGKMLQIQFRTPNMDKVANYGFAALWDLSGPAFAKSDMRDAIKRNISKPVHAIDRIYANNAEFMAHIKEEMLGDRNIVVYTPKHEAIELPYGATPIDFAYQVHTDIGNSLDYAIVNGKVKDRYYQLCDGDIVEAVTSQYTHPTVVWLEHIVTTRAYKKISEFVRIKESNQNANITDEAQKVLSKEIKKM